MAGTELYIRQNHMKYNLFHLVSLEIQYVISSRHAQQFLYCEKFNGTHANNNCLFSSTMASQQQCIINEKK